MKKRSIFLELYYEFFHCISWPKWKELKDKTILIFFLSIFLSIFLYVIDGIFILIVKILFSL
ncbi:preprotein translocase subunit SecE [Blattabacterium cuenoti]|uniref:preprotein translocase subunit SecE n=1 Tax=Blattabacterium cuenoti TaxID=1653831 RepID=UPI00163C5C7A|nr:preprotein translocase subunit SecE [Blattabacterium cuenoti]